MKRPLNTCHALQGRSQGTPKKSIAWGEAQLAGLTFHDQLSVVGHTGATIRADDAAVLAHAPLGSVRHADCGREAPVVDHTGDHEGRVPPIPLLQDRGREEGKERRNHMLVCSWVTRSTEAPPVPTPLRPVTFHVMEFFCGWFWGVI